MVKTHTQAGGLVGSNPVSFVSEWWSQCLVLRMGREIKRPVFYRLVKVEDSSSFASNARSTVKVVFGRKASC